MPATPRLPGLYVKLTKIDDRLFVLTPQYNYNVLTFPQHNAAAIGRTY